MHALFVHPNYPAQFGHLAVELARRFHWRATLVSEKPPGKSKRIERIRYKPHGGATRHNHFCTRTFENSTRHAFGVYRALRRRRDLRPDVIIGHAGFGTTLFLRELFDCPIMNYFEYFYRPGLLSSPLRGRGAGGEGVFAGDNDLDFRPDFPSTPALRLRSRALNAMILLDLDNCTLGYSPMPWQRSRFPKEYQHKIRTIFDGIDTDIWRPIPNTPRVLGEQVIPNDTRIVTYATRGMESMRGFDIFMEFARRLAALRKDVIFLIAGEDRICYGGDQRVTGKKTFKEWVLSQPNWATADLSRFIFLGRVHPLTLVQLFNISDLHVYLTVPFILSWSLFNALACGTTVLASRTAPVVEAVQHGKNGLLADFGDVDAMLRLAHQVLNDPPAHRPLGQAGIELIRTRYSIDVCLPQMLAMYADALALEAGKRGGRAGGEGREDRADFSDFSVEDGSAFDL